MGERASDELLAELDRLWSQEHDTPRAAANYIARFGWELHKHWPAVRARAEAAEAENARLRALLAEPSEEMLDRAKQAYDDAEKRRFGPDAYHCVSDSLHAALRAVGRVALDTPA